MDETLKARRIRAAIEQGLEIDPLLNKDYVPSGEAVSLGDLNDEDVVPMDHPHARCCIATCHDVQSGPIFCGEPATTMILLGGEKAIYFCGRHSLTNLKRKRRRREEEDEDRADQGRYRYYGS